jgi:protein import protein ZIM17
MFNIFFWCTQCAGCEAYHKLVDNLGLIVEYDFRDDPDGSSKELRQG